ncbi:hypothetical protein BLNAU_21868 [Blattamonas nauphoetae]|uniref:Uncharacterized protein n=1 Tax=Blattamonas nauphoetae TaxID=2049346 RepID=A0ABQ9WX33_9EUKA|nr:hypothetical protein BLNAU_21868 [Blattamonas nauphoetae]
MQSILVLVSSASPVVTTAGMTMLSSVMSNCSENTRFSLVKADLIPQLVFILNPLSLSFTEAVDIHCPLLNIITVSLWPSTPDGLEHLGIQDASEQRAVHKTIVKQVLVPSENLRLPTSSHLSNLDSGRCMNTSQIVPSIFSRPNFLASSILSLIQPPRHCSKLVRHTPATLFASLVVALTGQAKRRVGYAGQVGRTVRSQIDQDLESSDEGLRRTLSLAKHVLSPFNRYSAVIPLDGDLMKISVDRHPTSTLPSNSIDDVPTLRLSHRSVSGFVGLWELVGRSDNNCS